MNEHDKTEESKGIDKPYMIDKSLKSDYIMHIIVYSVAVLLLIVTSQIVRTPVGYFLTALLSVGCVIRIVHNIQYLRMQFVMDDFAQKLEEELAIIYSIEDTEHRHKFMQVLATGTVYDYDEQMRDYVVYEETNPLPATIREKALHLIEEHRTQILEDRGKYETYTEVLEDGTKRMWCYRKDDIDE